MCILCVAALGVGDVFVNVRVCVRVCGVGLSVAICTFVYVFFMCSGALNCRLCLYLARVYL